jgi:hypothetical protein
MSSRVKDLLTKFALRCLFVFLFLEASTVAVSAGVGLFACNDPDQAFFSAVSSAPFVMLAATFWFLWAYRIATLAITIVLTIVDRSISFASIR